MKLVKRGTLCRIWDFRFFMATSLKMAVFLDVASCSLVEVYIRFGGPNCLHHQGDKELENDKADDT